MLVSHVKNLKRKLREIVGGLYDSNYNLRLTQKKDKGELSIWLYPFFLT